MVVTMADCLACKDLDAYDSCCPLCGRYYTGLDDPKKRSQEKSYIAFQER